MTRPSRVACSGVMRLVLAAATAGFSVAEGQAVMPVGDEIRCNGCRVVLEEVATLGVADGPGMIESDNESAVRDARGRWYVHGNYGREIRVYDPAGAYRSTIGRGGAGPGEFGRISAVRVGPGDTLYVFDAEHHRVVTISPDHEIVATQRLDVPPTMDVVVLPDGFVLGSHVPSAELVGLPLHQVDRRGRLVRSFGSLTGAYRFDVPHMASRAVAVDRRGHLVAAHRGEYVIESWRTDGTFVWRIERTARWFPPQREPRRVTASRPPAPLAFAIQVDDLDRIWTLTLVAGQEWRRAVARGDGFHDRVTDIDQYYDTQIEVIDPARGVVLGRLRVPNVLTNFVGPGLVGAVVTDADGVPFYRVWRVRLEVPDRAAAEMAAGTLPVRSRMGFSSVVRALDQDTGTRADYFGSPAWCEPGGSNRAFTYEPQGGP